MATKKQTLTAEQAYRGALLNLAQLGFEVAIEDNPSVTRIRHPQAALLPFGTHVDTAKILYSGYKDRVEVNGRRVALGEVISRAVEASLRDVEAARSGLEQARKVEQAKGEQYAALVAAGFEKATKGLVYKPRYAYVRSHAESLGAEGEGLKVDVKRGDANGVIVLTVEASAEGYAALAKLTSAASKAAGA